MTVPRLYRWALGVLPGDFRRRYGRDMAAMFEDAWRAAGPTARVRLAVRAARDLAASAVALRLRRGRAGHGGPGRGTWENGRSGMFGTGWGRDVRYAVRGLLARPGFALVAVVTVGLGVGASSAVFSVVDAVVFRALPYADAGRMVTLWTEFDAMGDQPFGLSEAEYMDLREEQEAFTELGVYGNSEATWIPAEGDPVRLPVAWVYPGLLPVVDARARLGRLPSRAEVEPGASPLLLLTHGAWTARFGSDPDVVGRTLDVGGSSLEVVGVLAEGVRLPDGDAEAWLVWRQDRATIQDRSGHWLTAVGLPAPGVSLEQVRAELETVEARWRERFAGEHSPGHSGHRFVADGLEETVLGASRGAALALAASAGLLLLLACVNVAGLLVARGEGRTVELGVRAALGAGRAVLARQVLIESMVLALVGGVLGFALAAWGTEALLSLDPGSLPGLDRVRPDGRTLAFALVAASATGLAFGLLPVARLPVDGSAAVLRRGGRGAGGGARPLLSGLVVGQVALATVVVVAAGLLLRSRAALDSVDPGFRTGDAVVFDLSISSSRYDALADIDAFWRTLHERLEALPGVRSVGMARSLPLRSSPRRENILLEEAEASEDPSDGRPVVYQAAHPGWLEAMGIRLVAGRDISPADRADAPHVALVSESAAEAYWPEGALGRRFRATFAPRDHPLFTVVGVVADVHQGSLDAEDGPQVYLPVAQSPVPGRPWVRRATVVLRGPSGPAEVAAGIRRVVRELEPTAPVEGLASLGDIVRGAGARTRFLSLLLGVFAAAALAVAAVGVYGVVSFVVARRRREFGVRLALGAEPGRLLAGVLRSGAVLAAAGGALGLVGALLLGPALSRLLFGVGARDAAALAAGPAVLLVTVLAASWVPARRASAVAPVESLRGEA